MSFYEQIYIFLKLYNNVRTVNHNNFTFLPPVMLNPKSTGLFPPGAALGGGGGSVFTPLCKIRSRHPRKLKFTGLITYVMFYKICKFESLTVINDVIMMGSRNNGKMWYLTLTSIKFDPDN